MHRHHSSSDSEGLQFQRLRIHGSDANNPHSTAGDVLDPNCHGGDVKNHGKSHREQKEKEGLAIRVTEIRGIEDAECVREESMDVALRDGGLVTQIVQRLDSEVDRHAAALVCRVWNEAVTWGAHKLVVRCRDSLPQLGLRFWHITDLDLSQCTSQLEDEDLRLAAGVFLHLKTLRIGDREQTQTKITDEGVEAFASSCEFLEEVHLSSLPLLRDSGISVLIQGCTNLRCLDLESLRSLGDEALEAIAHCRNLQELSLKGDFRFSSAGLTVIGRKCGGLIKLVLDLIGMNIDMALKSISHGCHRLREISLKFKSANLRELSRCTSLRSLSVVTEQEDSLDDAVLAISSSNRNLNELTCVNRLSDSAIIGVILKCPRLRKLHLDASILTEAALLCIMHCKSLTDLSLDHFMSTGQGLAEIGLCGLDFKKFSLSHARGVRDVELQMLMDGNRELEYLNLQGCSGPTAIGFSAIASCSNLKSLDLSYTPVDDLSLVTIASEAQHLKQLIISKCEAVTNMSVVARFTSLESLILDQCSFVTDEGLDILSKKCNRLTHLSLAFTRVTDTGLGYMSKCQMLRDLRIPYCKGVQGEGVIIIAKACGWFHHVVMSHRFRGSRIVDTLKQLCCTVHLEMDELALVPFDANLLFM
jgi:F-box/leucine-rich repeat protein 2/20